MIDEKWLPVPDYEGIYEVSDQGRVRSIDRVVHDSRGIARRIQGRIMKPSTSKYWTVALSDAPRPERFFRVHHLVAAAFIGPRPEGAVVRHLDDRKDNNRLTNLAYGSQGENMRDIVRNGNHADAKKTHCPQGHPYAGENLRIRNNGNRQCRTCIRVRDREYWKKRSKAAGREEQS